MFLLNLVRHLNDRQIKFAIAGGYAVVLHGLSRGTVDVDIVVLLSKVNLANAENALNELGLVSRIPVNAQEMIQFRIEYIEKRNLIAWSFSNPKNPTQAMHIIITHDLKKMKTVNMSLHGLKVPVLTKKTLIAMKRAAGRPQDLEDVRGLEELSVGDV